MLKMVSDYTRSAMAASPDFDGLLMHRSAPADGRRVDRGIARFDSHVDHRQPTGLDMRDRRLEYARQVVGMADRPPALPALRLGEHAEVGFGVGDALADPAVLH